MPAEVVMKVVQGGLAGKDYHFCERATCIIGRAGDCDPQIPDEEPYRKVSRHHCLVDINPPAVRVRDMGSLNGTYVNGEKIGQRQKDQTPEEAAETEFPQRDLADGDKISLGREDVLAFEVGISIPIQIGRAHV